MKDSYTLMEQKYKSLLSRPTVGEGDSKAPFSVATTLKCKGGHYTFSG